MSSAILPAFSISEEPISYWKFDHALSDSGSLNVKLKNTFPIYTCNTDVTTYCFDLHDTLLRKINYTTTQFDTGIHFNGKTYLTSGYENESKYDFLNSRHPFTIETWITPTQLCEEETCFHHYFISKTDAIPHAPGLHYGDVIGFACAIQRDGSFFCYFRNVFEYLHIETLSNYSDGIPKKLSIVYTGDETYDGLSFYVNGELVDKKPCGYYENSDYPLCRIEHQTENNQPLVIGNYWIKYINPLVNTTLDEFKIYDYAKTNEQIKFDYLYDIDKQE